MTTTNNDRTRGQAMVEFALVFIIFAWGIFAVIDFARYVYGNNSLNEVAREAARQGTVAYRPADCSGNTSANRVTCIQTIAKNRLVGVPIALSDVQVVCQRPGITGLPASKDTHNCTGGWQANDLVRVKITSNLNLVTPLMGQFLGSAPMSGEAQVTAN
jgi:Flp pilus assembly protein TadG